MPEASTEAGSPSRPHREAGFASIARESVEPRSALSSLFGSRRAVGINRMLTVWLCTLIVFDVVFDRRSDIVLDTVISLPLATFFAVASTKLARGAVPSSRWLVLSGSSCVLFGAVSTLSISTALETSPIDYACAFWATTMAAMMGYAAWYQLRIWRTIRSEVRH
jgi:hypothetical protein